MLIFGGTGFIGRHLCHRLFKGEQEATVISRSPDLNFASSLAPFIDAMSLADFEESQDKILRQTKTIIYAASCSVPHTFVDRPWLEYELNVLPAMKLFSKASALNPNVRIVFISSGGTVYGANHTQPISEQAAIEPISPYGLGKSTIEQGLEFMGRTKNLDYRILRVSNPFGRWQSNPTQGIIPIAINAALQNKPIHIFDGGRQVRDFVDADDLAEGILKAAEEPNAVKTIMNIGSGRGMAIHEVLSLVESALGIRLKKNHFDGRSSDVLYSVLDCAKAKAVLNWEAATLLSGSIEKFVKHRVG